MKRTEINSKFDEIVAFAEVEKFIDTPIKHYSTGMHLRLAFAVAAYLEPEILLIDEVLAVGDAAFQKKCVGQMGKVAREGRTILFVSHNMAAVRALCSRAAVLDRGRLCFDGDTEHAIDYYNRSVRFRESGLPSAEVSFTDVRINGTEGGPVLPGESFEVSCRLHLRSSISGFQIVCVVEDAAGEQIAVVVADHHQLEGTCGAGSHDIVVRFPPLWLRTGVYNVYFKIMASALGLLNGRFVSDSAMLDVAGDSHPGVVRSVLIPAVQWRMKDVDASDLAGRSA
jgi:lipopolysaccharide transport system ATP-binding protein